ncbi:MAG TPA: hypothetical protein VE987_07560 [Polyangiaceae bacterium]|nr:hypothetical protein [Polyangiaceae bacterium]
MANTEPQSSSPLPGAWRRLLSVTGLVPLGAFLVLHAAVNALALRDGGSFATAVAAIHHIPGLVALEWALVLAPLALHAALGSWLLATRKTLVQPCPYPGPLRAIVRATGVAAIGFVALHLPELRFRMPGARLGGGEIATVLAADLSSTYGGVPWRGAFYLVGTACVVFHFAAGAWGWFASTRRGSGARARRWAAWGAVAAGGALWLLFASTVVFHATGSRLLGGSERLPPSTARCPAPDGPPAR